MTRYYDWESTLSRYNPATHDAETILVIGGRGIGKTFGLRKRLIQRFISHGEMFVEVVRYANELKGVQAGYFTRFDEMNTFPGYVFKAGNGRGYIAEEVGDGEKPDWKVICYFVALTQQQSLKKTTFPPSVRYVLMDEAILERSDVYHRYLPDEFVTFANMLNTIFRETPNDGKRRQVILLGNSCDLLNPYFQYLGIDFAPRHGINWYRGKTVLLDYVQAWDAEERKAETLVGRLLAGNEEGEKMFDNKFADANLDFVEKKSPRAKYAHGIAFKGCRYGIWLDFGTATYYVTDQIPKNHENTIFALTNKDGRIDYQMVSRTEKALKGLIQFYYAGSVRYSSPAIRTRFAEVLKFLGVA